MKKNGFTLIELMGIIIMLVLISLISVPTVVNMKKKTEQKDYNTYIKDITMIGETYISINKEKYPKLKEPNTVIYITASTLINEGYVKENKKNPKTKTKIAPNEGIKVTVNPDNTITCEYIEKLPE